MSQINFIRQVVYSLKRRYGVPVELHQILGSEVDLATGEKTINQAIHKVKRAILLPRQFGRADASILGEMSNRFIGLLVSNRRTIIIDMRDYPASYELGANDYVIISGCRYNLNAVEFFDYRLAAILTVTEVDGEVATRTAKEALQSNLTLSDAAVEES
jgi:hypothetical protein